MFSDSSREAMRDFDFKAIMSSTGLSHLERRSDFTARVYIKDLDGRKRRVKLVYSKGRKWELLKKEMYKC
jgi:hypothetical protein